jgi:hypothetical protein
VQWRASSHVTRLARVLPLELATGKKVTNLPQLASADPDASRRLFLHFIRNKGEVTAQLSI